MTAGRRRSAEPLHRLSAPVCTKPDFCVRFTLSQGELYIYLPLFLNNIKSTFRNIEARPLFLNNISETLKPFLSLAGLLRSWYNSDMNRGKIVRTVMSEMEEGGVNHPGIYVIAYMGMVVYIGKAYDSVTQRLKSHMLAALKPSEQLGKWLIRVNDWHNIRLDVIYPPEDADVKAWNIRAEAALINEFAPLLNVQLNT